MYYNRIYNMVDRKPLDLEYEYITPDKYGNIIILQGGDFIFRCKIEGIDIIDPGNIQAEIKECLFIGCRVTHLRNLGVTMNNNYYE